jgi:hypothetical protein
MANPNKKARKHLTPQRLTAFLTGLALPLCLIVVWRLAYGQQEAVLAPQVQMSAPAVQTTVAAPSREEPKQELKQEPSPDPGEELSRMREFFQAMVRQPTIERLDHYKKLWAKSPKISQIMEERRLRLNRLDKSYLEFVRGDVKTEMAKAGLSFEASQYFLYADRNPQTQIVIVGFYDAPKDAIEFLGADLISSGNLDRGGDYFVTPVGVFENSLDNFSYRALGTPNQEGWRGLGAKDSRVWDFGFQKSLKKYKEGNTVSQMRLLMHSTDPDKGEPRLGRIDSKGCIRISQGLNRFLDNFAILDQEYEGWAKTKPDSWLLKKDRQPVIYPGKYLIVGDSSQRQSAAKGLATARASN